MLQGQKINPQTLNRLLPDTETVTKAATIQGMPGYKEENGTIVMMLAFLLTIAADERQRTAIARAFMNDPSIILADEPTAGLDTKRAHEVVSLIAKEVKLRNKAAIMVTHHERINLSKEDFENDRSDKQD